MDEINQYAALRGWSSRQWTDILQKYIFYGHFVMYANYHVLSRYYIDPSCIIVSGKPSANMAEKLEKDEKARIAAQVEKLGPDGLKMAGKELDDAKAEHEKPIPTDILNSFPVPDVKSIAWIPVQSVQEKGTGRDVHTKQTTSDLSRHIDSDGSALPFFVQYDHVQVRAYFTSYANIRSSYGLNQSDFVSIHGFFSLAKLPNRLRP